MEDAEWERIARMMDERVRDVKHSDGSDVTLGSIWAAFIDFRKEMRKGFDATHDKQDKTNGRLTALERFTWVAIGGMAVLTFLVSVFGVTALVMMR